MAAISLIGDFTCQIIENKYNHKGYEFNWKRNFTFGLTSLIFNGPVLAIYFTHFLPRILAPAGCKYMGLKKTAFHQGILAPIFIPSWVIISNLMIGNNF